MPLDLLHIWWLWLSAALLLAIAEVFLPGFIFLGFAAGAALTAPLAAWAGLSLTQLLLAFALLSLLSWVVMRRAFGLRKGQEKRFDYDINED